MSGLFFAVIAAIRSLLTYVAVSLYVLLAGPRDEVVEPAAGHLGLLGQRAELLLGVLALTLRCLAGGRALGEGSLRDRAR